jgi:NAD(P)-dependent dehydrogenase (short-subunit alcohol dehydrogenase family)
VRDLPAGRQARPPTAQISVQLGVQIGDRPGIIAVTGSPAGDLGLPMSAPNSAAKAALRLFLDTCRTELAATHIDLVARYHGFTNTAALDPEDVPVQAFIIAADRAAREMAWALERRRAHHLFPKRIALLIGLARLLPEPVRRRVLQGAA